MEKARHVATGKIVPASEVDYTNYPGIFECPVCKVQLSLRRGYTRSDGISARAAFVHPNDGTEVQKQCRLRVGIGTSSFATGSQSGSSSPREQFYNLLKENFIRCLKMHSKANLIEYSRKYMRFSERNLKSLDHFVEISNFVFKQPQNGGHIYSREKHIRKKCILLMQLGTNLTKIQQEQIKSKTKSIIWGMEFLIDHADDDLRKKALEYIFGRYVFSGELKIRQNHKRLTDIFGFSRSTILGTKKVFSDEQLRKEFYTKMYGNLKELRKLDQISFDKALKFHNQLFEWIIDYFVAFDWRALEK